MQLRLGVGPIVLAAIPEMLLTDLMPWVEVELSLRADQRQVLSDHNAAVVKEHVVIRAQAEYVVGTIRSVVRGPERPNVRGLRVGTGQTFQAGSKLLFSLGLPKYNAQL